MIFDSHLHTDFSADSTMLFEEAKREANKQKIGIVTTEHLDYNYPDLADFTFDFDEYFKKYKRYRGNDVKLGIEIGMRPECLEAVSYTHLKQDIVELSALEDNIKTEASIGPIHGVQPKLKVNPNKNAVNGFISFDFICNLFS